MRCRLAIAPVLLFLATLASAQQTPPKSADDALLDELYKVRTFHEVAMSPDGRLVAWAERNGGIFVAPGDGSRPATRVTAGGKDEHELAWAPDSKQLAFLSAGEAHGQRQLYVARVDSTDKPHRLTSFKGFAHEPAWSPDGRSIAFLFIANAAREAGPLVAMSRDVGVVEEHIFEQRVAIVPVAEEGKLRVVSPDDMYVYHFDWSPDSTRLAATAAPGSGDNNYWIAQLHVIDVARGTMKSIYKPKLQIADPRWSPDGKHIAFIEGLMSDEGSTGGDVYVINPDGTKVANLSSKTESSTTSLNWASTITLALGVNMAGESAIGHVDLAALPFTESGWLGGTPLTVLWHAPEVISAGDVIGASWSRDGKYAAVIRSAFNRPPEVWAGQAGAWKQLSHANDGVDIRWARAQSIEWTSDKYQVQGWLLEPRNAGDGAKHPMVVWIHGGPASASLASWPREEALLLANAGFYVFYPNPRGSYGKGEMFTQANVKDFGYGDLRDILSGVDAVVKANPIDDKHVGIWGWSYGGYMTMWAVTQTNRFRSAIAGAGLSNWQSYYGENDIDQWMIPYFGASVYDDPAVYAKSSPMTFIKNVKTPTLVVVGERDGEVPAPQSYEFWHALKTFGVETQLVVYPDEGHHFVKEEHRRDLAHRVVAWFERTLR